MKKFYDLVLRDQKGYENIQMQINEQYSKIKNGCEAQNWESIIFKLKNGKYRHFNMIYHDYPIFLISADLKDVFQPFVEKDTNIEFLQTTVSSPIYGNLEFYIMHFKIIPNFLNIERSVVIPKTKSITIPCVDCEKVKGFDIFLLHPIHDLSIIITDKVRKIMKQKKLDAGIDFWEILSSEEPIEERALCNTLNETKKQTETEQETENPEAIMFNNKKYLQSTKLNRGNMKEDVFDWLHTLEKKEKIPADIKALNFGLCEGVKGYFAYLIGAEDYDAEDDDWACAEDYEPETKYLEFDKGETLDMDWETFQDKMKACLTEYMNREGNAKTSVFYGKIITTGFDDGDLVRVR